MGLPEDGDEVEVGESFADVSLLRQFLMSTVL